MSIKLLTGNTSGYKTKLGEYQIINSVEWMENKGYRKHKNSIDLIVTSPPFPLNRKKSYGNLKGEKYIEWISDFFQKCVPLLSETGSLVIELGNAWNQASPTISTLPIEVLLKIKKDSNLHLCQELICHNPARLPTPTQYVNVERIRLKDSWTRIWWLSKTENPKANNRNSLLPYSKAMKNLLATGKYNSGRRPSEHVIGSKSFLTDNGGAIPASCLTNEELDHFGSLLISSNTKSTDPYLEYCRENSIIPHPARMQPALATFFISLLTNEGDCVYDPFAGTNTTGYCCEKLNRRWIATEINYDNMFPSMARF
jgi:site-specific DNA-methyltransferase (cytosine-N4-specific)